MLVGILYYGLPRPIFLFLLFIVSTQDLVGICPLLTQWTKMVFQRAMMHIKLVFAPAHLYELYISDTSLEV